MRMIRLSSISCCRLLCNSNSYEENYIKMYLGILSSYHFVYLLVWQCHTNRGCTGPFFCDANVQGSVPLFQLQYIVPRLSLEARGILCKEEKTDLLWNTLSHTSLNYRRASLCLWKQARFQELLKEKAFQV